MKIKEIFFLIIALCLSVSTAQADINIPPDITGDLSVSGSTIVNLNTGGQVTGSIWSAGTSTVNVKGGSVGATLNSYDNSVLNVYNGSIATLLTTSDNSTAHIYGGSIGGPIYTWQSSKVYIYGTGFNYSYGPIPDFSGLLTGTLSNGDLLSVNFGRAGEIVAQTMLDPESEIFLRPVPVPSAVILGGLGLITAGWRLRKRKNA